MARHHQRQARHDEDEEHREEEKRRHASLRPKPIAHTGQQQGIDEEEEAHAPIGDELGEHESGRTDGAHVDLLHCAALLFTHNVEGGEKSHHEDKEHGDDGRNHVVLVVERGVE